jgi:hypothetical protein
MIARPLAATFLLPSLALSAGDRVLLRAGIRGWFGVHWVLMTCCDDRRFSDLEVVFELPGEAPLLDGDRPMG